MENADKDQVQVGTSEQASRRRFLLGAAGGVAAAGLLPMTAAQAAPAPARAVPTRGKPSWASGPPREAIQEGFCNLVFGDAFGSTSTIDMENTIEPGYKWYTDGWFCRQPTSPDKINISQSVVTLGGGEPNPNYQKLSSAVAIPEPPYYVGTVFGGGAYFEASMAFDPAQGVNAGRGRHPGCWMMSIEHIYDNYHCQPNHLEDEQWPGMPEGYLHFAEIGILEAYRQPFESYEGKTYYLSADHDWSGFHPPGCATGMQYSIFNSENMFFAVGEVDWSAFHTYGCLWVPQQGDTPGYTQRFFDNRPGPINYHKGPVGEPPLPGQGMPCDPSTGRYTADTPDEAAATYAIRDQHRFPIQVRGTAEWPLQVDWLRVWQKPGS